MAWAEKLASGRYRGVYRDGSGRRRSAGTFAHKAAARREAAAQEAVARRKLWRDPEAYKRPWGEWVEEWMKGRSVESSTAASDRVRLETHLKPRWHKVPIGSITRHDVKTWAVELGDERSAATVARIVHLFSASMNAAVDAEVIEVNPALRMDLGRGSSGGFQGRFLTRDEYEAIRDEMPTTRDQLVCDLLVWTGMRWGEMAGLHGWRVDQARGVVSIADTFDEASGRIKPYPKGKRGREVPLVPELREALKGAVRGETCGVEHVSGWCRSGLVVTTEQGRPLRNTNWSPIWRDAVERAGVGRVRIHDLRHTYASWLLQAGIPLAEVGRMLGHVSTQTTQKYAHLAEPPNAAVLAALALAAPQKPHDEENHNAV